MYKRFLLCAFLALPGSLVVLAVMCLHPRYRAGVSNLAGVPWLLARVNVTHR